MYGSSSAEIIEQQTGNIPDRTEQLSVGEMWDKKFNSRAPDLLSLLEHPEEGGHGSDVQGVCGDGHDVIQDASQLSVQHCTATHNTWLISLLIIFS